MTNITQLMKQAQQMQKKMQDAQTRLDAMTVEGGAGSGAVKVIMTCKGFINTLSIDASVVDKDDVEMLEDLLTAALNDARTKADELTAKEMSGVTGGMKLPF